MFADRTQTRAFALLAMVMVFWAGNSIVGRAVADDVPPLTLAFARWTGASLFLLPFAWRPLRRDAAMLLRHWKIVLLLGLLGVGAFNALLYSGLHYTTATNALLLQAGIPAIVALLDRLIFGVRTSAWHSLGVAASILGVVAIVFEGDPHAAMRLHFGKGDLLVLGSVAVWSFYTILLRLRPQVAATSFVASTFLIGVAAMAPFALWEWQQGLRVHWGAGVAGAFLYVSLLPSIVSYFIYNHAAQVVGPARAGQAITLMPLFGAFLSALLLGERLHPYHFAGMALILAGIVVSVIGARGQSAAGAAAEPRLEERA